MISMDLLGKANIGGQSWLEAVLTNSPNTKQTEATRSNHLL